MKGSRRILLCLWASIGCAVSAASPVREAPATAPRLAVAELAGSSVPTHRIAPLRFQVGDDLSWASPGLEDSGWQRDVPRAPGNWWMRTAVTLEEPADAASDLALRIFLPAAFEVFWDGEAVARNGRVGMAAAGESPGRIVLWVSLDADRLGVGRHVLAVRASSHRTFLNQGLFEVELLERAASGRRQNRRTAFFLACAGVLLVAAIVFGLLYRATGRRRDTLLFALLCSAVGVMVLLEYVRYVHPYAYPWHNWRLFAISILAIVVGLLLPAFFLRHLGLAGQRWILPALALVYLGFATWMSNPDDQALWTLRASAAAAFLLAAWALWRRRPGGLTAVGAMLPVLVPTFFTGLRYADHWFFAGFVALVMVLLAELGVGLAREYAQRQEALVTAERLRNEMLRKTIQPHFLMNSLAAAIGHIEEQPARGIEVLRDLARELESFFTLSERQAVTLGEELELCHRHVATMRHLLDRPLELQVADAAAAGWDREIPPGVLLTLVENALTHGDWSAGGAIDLQIRDRGDTAQVEFSNPIRGDGDSDSEARERTGLSYVRRQLERTEFGCDLAYGAEGGRWVSRLTLSRRRTSA